MTDAHTLFAPLVARVIELGRGPPALVQWVNARRKWGLDPRELAVHLAREFARSAAVGDTLPIALHATRLCSEDRHPKPNVPPAINDG